MCVSDLSVCQCACESVCRAARLFLVSIGKIFVEAVRSTMGLEKGPLYCVGALSTVWGRDSQHCAAANVNQMLSEGTQTDIP